MTNWPITPLHEIFEIARGGSPRPIDDYITNDPSGVNWVMIGDGREGSKYISSTKRRIRPEGVTRSRRVNPGDFLLTNSMSFGRPYIMATSGCIHDGWLVLSPKRADVDSDFLYHLLGSSQMYAEFERQAAGATVKNLNIDVVKGVRIPLPPIAEQRRIANILDKADALRAKRHASLTRVDTLTHAIFLDMFGDPTHNPRGFPWTPLGSLVRAGDSINYGVVQPGDNVPEGIPLVRVSDLIDGRVEHSKLKRISPAIENGYRRSRLRGDELLVSCVGSAGLVALADESVKGFNVARAVARVPIRDDVNRIFIAAYLRTSFVQGYFSKELRTVSQPTLNIKQLSETPVALPPNKLQNCFAAKVSAVEALRTLHRRAVDQHDALFASLQHRAFSGTL